MELDGEKITDKVNELLYILDEGGNEFAAAVLSVSLVTFLDSVNDAKITEHVVWYLNQTLPDHLHQLQKIMALTKWIRPVCCKRAGSNINQIEIARVTVHDASTGLLPRPVALPLFELFRQRDHLPIWLKHPAKSTQEFETPLLNSLEC